MSNYETIKEVAMQLLQRKKITSLYYAREDYVNYAQNVIPLMSDALKVIENYPSDFAAYVVAFNVISSSARDLSDLTDKFQDKFAMHALIGMKNQARLLENSVLFLGRNINKEEAAIFLVQESVTLFHIIISVYQNLSESYESARAGLNKCINSMVTVCANLYKIAQSFHPSLEANKILYDFLEKLFDNVKEIISEEESLRPAQIKEIYQMIGDYADETVGQMSDLVDAEPEGDSSELYDVVLVKPGPSKLAIVKCVYEIKGCGLAEAKQLVDDVPSIVLSGVTKAKAENAVDCFDEYGATAECRISR